jgi:hypothetical protein
MELSSGKGFRNSSQMLLMMRGIVLWISIILSFRHIDYGPQGWKGNRMEEGEKRDRIE